MSQKLRSSVTEQGPTEAGAREEKTTREPETPTTAPPADDELPPYIESVQNGVINIRIEGNYRRATK